MSGQHLRSVASFLHRLANADETPSSLSEEDFANICWMLSMLETHGLTPRDLLLSGLQSALGRFANHDRSVVRRERLERYWCALEERGLAQHLGAKTLKAFAREAQRCRSARVAEGIWEVSGPFRDEFDEFTWGHLLGAAVLTSSAHASDMVRELQQSREIGTNIAASLAHDAGEAGNVEFLARVWEAVKGKFEQFRHEHWGSFLAGATRARSRALVDHVLRAFWAQHDPTVFVHVGSLDMPLILAAGCASDEVRRETLLRLEGAWPDLALYESVLSRSTPAALNGPGGPFEGACRCLARCVIHASYRTPSDFKETCGRVLDVVAELPPERRRAVWPRMLGRGQEAHAAALRLRHIEELEDVVSLPLRPWSEYSEEQRNQFSTMLQAKGGEGLLARICDLLQSDLEERLPPVHSEAGDRRFDRLAELMAQNHLDYLSGRPPALHRSTFFDAIDAELVSLGVDAWSAADGLAAMAAVARGHRARVQEHLFEPLEQPTHDILKEVIKERRRAAARRPDLAEQIAASVADLLQCFLFDLSRAGRPAQPPEFVNVGPDIRNMLGGHRESIREGLPKQIWLRCWAGARQTCLIPLLRTIRSNAETALRTLGDATDGHYDVTVSTAQEGYVRLEVSNAYALDAADDPDSTGLGLGNIRRRTAHLRGSVEFERRLGPEGEHLFVVRLDLPGRLDLPTVVP